MNFSLKSLHRPAQLPIFQFLIFQKNLNIKLKMAARKSKQTKPKKKAEEQWELRLYVAGQTPKSLTAFSNLKQYCEEHLKGKYRIQIIDLVKKPQLAKDHQILAIPTLVRQVPTPIRKIIGDLSNKEKVLVGLDIREF